MTIDPTMLLDLLGVGVRAIGGSEKAPTPAGVSFDAVLDRVSSRPVDLAPEIGQRLELSDDQLARLSEAVDRAEQSGIRRAVVKLDGHELVVDVQSRLVISDDALGDGGVLRDVDGVVRAASSAFEPTLKSAPDLLELLGQL